LIGSDSPIEEIRSHRIGPGCSLYLFGLFSIILSPTWRGLDC